MLRKLQPAFTWPSNYRALDQIESQKHWVEDMIEKRGRNLLRRDAIRMPAVLYDSTAQKEYTHLLTIDELDSLESFELMPGTWRMRFKGSAQRGRKVDYTVIEGGDKNDIRWEFVE